MADYVGQQLGNYRLRHLLGQGGSADVYLGEHIHLETLAAIKVLHIQMGSRDIDDFRREAMIIAHLLHPHIVRVLDFGVEGNMPFLVMDYAPKGTLREYHPKGTSLPLTTIVAYVKQVAQALQYAHERKVIHRDVKPENMLLGINNEVLLSDFGISAIEQGTSVLITQKRVGSNPAGTLLYMAPEQIQGKPHLASDQYALGIVVYEWLCGSRPFQGEPLAVMYQQVHVPAPPLREKIPTISPAVELVVLRALAKDPQHRFATIWAFAQALEQAAQAAPTATLPAWPILQVPPEQANQAVPTTTLPARALSGQPGLNPLSPPQAVDFSSLKEQAPAQNMQLRAAPGRVSKPVKPIRHRKGPSRSTAMLLLGLAFIIVAGSVAFLLSSLNNRGNAMSAANVQATATARTHATATASFLATATAASSAYNAAAANAIMLGFDPQHTHVNPYEKVLNPTNVSELVQDWKAPTGNSIGSVPTVANDVVYVSSSDGKMYAFDADTGHVLWTTPTGSYYLGSAPTVALGRVYIGSFDHLLHAFDARTGAPFWTAPTGGRIGSSPTLVNGVIYIGSDDGKLYAFNASTGATLWTVPTGGSIRSSPAVANGIVYVGSDDHLLYAIKAATGAMLWTIRTGGRIRSSPTVVNGIVYVGSEDHHLYAMKADTGGILWTASTGDSIFSSPAVANDVVYIGSNDGKLYALNATKGTLLWTASTGNSIFSSPTIANGVLYIGSNDHKLYAFNASGCGSASCLPLWSASTENIIRSSPTVANGVVYVGSEDHNLYAFHLARL
jgi:outer membrane protein assembly factor BamB/serine/threonine protein kinase